MTDGQEFAHEQSPELSVINLSGHVAVDELP